MEGIQTTGNEIEQTPIQEFYNNKSLFLTGGTGFFGKIIIEKLLRTTNIGRIYMLVRMKNGKDPQTRIDEIFNDPIFNQIKLEYRKKIIIINGDCGLINLGINLIDYNLLINNIDIIIHGAATVRFDEKLKCAINININGTKEILKLCYKLNKNLLAFVHISTAFANCNHKIINEKFYEPYISGNNVIELNNLLDEITLNQLTSILLNDYPNTYTFTKSLAENLIQNELIVNELNDNNNQNSLPIIIFRPGIVLTTYNEPIKGWIDNMYGPIGIILGVGYGIVRCFHANRKYRAHIVPVDLSINALLATAWDISKNYKNYDNNIKIYNYIPDMSNPITWHHFLKYSYEYGIQIPMSKLIWYPVIYLTQFTILFNIMSFLLHTMPAYLMDFCLICVGKQPRMKKIYKKVNKYGAVLSYFCNDEWTFTNDNTRNLWTKLSAKDQELFFFDMQQIEWRKLLNSSLLGLRTYLAKDDPTTIPMAIKRLQRFKILHYSIVYTIYAFIAYIFYFILTKIF